jgi:nitrogen regulatory protein PII
METVIFILNDVDLLNEVLRAWEDVGIRGVTVLRSTGLGRIGTALYRDDAPLFPSLRELLEHDEMHHFTLMSVVDSRLVDAIIAATEQITGPLSQPNSGMLFTMPVSRVVGGQVNSRSE